MNKAIRPLLGIVALCSLCTVALAGEGNDVKSEKTIEIAIKVPTPSWSINIHDVRMDDTGYYVISRLSKADGFAMQMIATARDVVKITGPDLPVRHHFVLGKTWNWENKEPVTFVDNEQALEKRIPEKAVRVDLP